MFLSRISQIQQYQDAMEKEKLELERKLAENSCKDKSKPHCGPFMMKGRSKCPSLYDNYPNGKEFLLMSKCSLGRIYMSQDHKLYLPESRNLTQYINNHEEESCMATSDNTDGFDCVEIDLPKLRQYAYGVEKFALPTMCGNVNITVTEDYQLIFPCFVGIKFDKNDPKKCELEVSEALHPQDCNMEVTLSDHLIAKLKKERKEKIN